MSVAEWTEQQLTDYLDSQGDPEWRDQTMALIGRWLERGDSAAIYENHDLGHPEMGSCRIASYGSAAAQLEMSYPPDRLPDIGNQINWRYVLIATYGKAPAGEGD